MPGSQVADSGSGLDIQASFRETQGLNQRDAVIIQPHGTAYPALVALFFGDVILSL
jgi:hypothetical protein